MSNCIRDGFGACGPTQRQGCWYVTNQFGLKCIVYRLQRAEIQQQQQRTCLFYVSKHARIYSIWVQPQLFLL